MKENMKKIEETMRLSIFEVFEKMFFIFLEPLIGECDEYDMEAAIRFEGFLSGEVRILFSIDIAKNMIQNMLGLKGNEITTQRIEDCSKEAVNMVCGNFFGKLDNTKIFDLSIPVFSKKYRGFGLNENTCIMNFNSDSGRACVIIEVS